MSQADIQFVSMCTRGFPVSILNGFDRRVYNSLCTLWLFGEKNVTPNRIFAVMHGFAKRSASTDQARKIMDSINKMSDVVVYVDIGQNVRIDNMLYIQTNRIKRADGKKCTMIKIISEPILLTYNKAKKTLISVPTECISNSDLNTTEKILAIQDYLLMRIVNFKKKRFPQKKILYYTMYRDSGVKTPELSKDRIRDRRKIYKLMDGWVDKGLIKSYQDIRKGRAYKGIAFEADRFS